jgi:hypothetical protein
MTMPETLLEFELRAKATENKGLSKDDVADLRAWMEEEDGGSRS